MGAFFSDWGGLAIAILGGALAAALCCAGSARGCGITGEAGTGLLSEDPSNFAKVMILQVIPGTQGLYGFVIWFIVISKLQLLSGTPATVSIEQGLQILGACMPMALAGGISAPAQGRVAAGTVNLLAKKPNDWFKGVMLCAVVEFYAILGLLASFLMISNITLG
ncbi:MAG: V-type ATP synthase subunit K [Clostridia bacterium]|nr:V-type ATP synthase subunit K [Clostridia bacterium]